jgi:hypothetical protein
MEKGRNISPEQLRIEVIKEAYGRGVRYENITPDMQLAPWLAIGLKRLGEGQDLTPEDITGIDKMGGTDHPDPYVF